MTNIIITSTMTVFNFRRNRNISASKQTDTVIFHNFQSQNFKLSVSNPKSKYVAYLSVLSQISNCQGLGRKNKHEILKADRIINNRIETKSQPIHHIELIV